MPRLRSPAILLLRVEKSTPFYSFLILRYSAVMNRNQFPHFDLSGKVAIVTGAGRGMGYSMSQALAQNGADLVICSRTVSELERAKEEI